MFNIKFIWGTKSLMGWAYQAKWAIMMYRWQLAVDVTFPLPIDWAHHSRYWGETGEIATGWSLRGQYPEEYIMHLIRQYVNPNNINSLNELITKT